MDFQYVYEIDTTNIWTLSDIGAIATETLTLGDSGYGHAIMSTGQATVDTGFQMQDVAANPLHAVYPWQQYLISWESRAYVGRELNGDWFMGLAVTDTSLMSALGVMTCNNYIGFHHTSDAATITLVQNTTAGAEITIATSPSPYTLADLSTNYYRYGIRIENNNVMYWYIDDIQVGSTYVGATETGGVVGAFGVAGLAQSFAIVNGDSGENDLEIDYIRTVGTRY
jgi:hypothetical protein